MHGHWGARRLLGTFYGAGNRKTRFANVNVFKAHVNVGFFRGAEIADPEGLLEGAGKFMRHLKLRPEHDADAKALMKLIETAYTDMKRRLKAE